MMGTLFWPISGHTIKKFKILDAVLYITELASWSWTAELARQLFGWLFLAR